jgi:hypothetical protein
MFRSSRVIMPRPATIVDTRSKAFAPKWNGSVRRRRFRYRGRPRIGDGVDHFRIPRAPRVWTKRFRLSGGEEDDKPHRAVNQVRDYWLEGHPMASRIPSAVWVIARLPKR